MKIYFIEEKTLRILKIIISVHLKWNEFQFKNPKWVSLEVPIKQFVRFKKKSDDNAICFTFIAVSETKY